MKVESRQNGEIKDVEDAGLVDDASSVVIRTLEASATNAPPLEFEDGKDVEGVKDVAK